MADTSFIVTPDFIAFGAQCEAAGSLDALETVWRARLGELGFTFMALGAHVDPLKPERATYVFQNYPEEWIAHFSAQRYHLIDPVFRAADAGVTDFIWTDREFRQPLSWRQRRILGEASEFGLRYGRTHSLSSIDLQKASGSLVATVPDVPEHVYDAGRIANILVHHRAVQLCAEPAPRFEELQRRERQALELCASGLTDAEIARKLEIGVATVRRHIERARVRLGASTRIQAAARAIASGQIKPIV
ncbi:MAG: LuxR family transcriptional regulator [Hyphomonadaceae bacterium]|nr:LuxR family transcriptional regulator [Hyphomonadaceae bacterium]